MSADSPRVGVYGLGRFGSFWAEHLARHFPVSVYSRNPDRPTPHGTTRVSEAEVLDAETLILCVAISAFEGVVSSIAPALRPGMEVLDTCSVKVHPAAVMEKFLPVQVGILATHPMFGPDSAQRGLAGLPMILSPVRMSEDRVGWWRGLFESLGLRVVTMRPEEHDREAAFTQGIAHYIGRVLADLKLQPSDIGTVGYQKLLEIMEQTCNDPWQLFLDLQRYNPFTREMRQQLHSSLDRIMHTLDQSFDSQAPGEARLSLTANHAGSDNPARSNS